MRSHLASGIRIGIGVGVGLAIANAGDYAMTAYRHGIMRATVEQIDEMGALCAPAKPKLSVHLGGLA